MICVHHEIEDGPGELHVGPALVDPSALYEADEDEYGRLEHEEDHGHAHDHDAHALDLLEALDVLALGAILGHQHLVYDVDIAYDHEHEGQYDLNAGVEPREHVVEEVLVLGTVRAYQTLRVDVGVY